MEFCPDRFFSEANNAYFHDNKGQRYGQFLINFLRGHYLDVYSKLESTQDCFYDDSKVGEFMQAVYSYESV
jgi:hypothetical protein